MPHKNIAGRALHFLSRRWKAFNLPEARELRRLRRILGVWPRYKPGRVKAWGWDLEFVDAASFISTFDSIVAKGWYDFKTEDPYPYILDCGSNIGISVLYFKRRYPGAEIVAFEPDPNICQTLRRNLLINNAADVKVVEAALCDQEGEIFFERDGADGGKLCNNEDGKDNLKVKTIRLVNYINKPVEMLKIDIEGSETKVVPDIAECLDRVNRLIIEYHARFQPSAGLSRILTLLEDHRFTYYINSGDSGDEWIDFLNYPEGPLDSISQLLMVYAKKLSGRQSYSSAL